MLNAVLARGDVAAIADLSKPRPAIILQAPLFAPGCGFRFVRSPRCRLMPRCSASPLQTPESGLLAPSWAMIDRVGVIRPERIGQRIGHLDQPTLLAICDTLLVFFGLA